MIEVYVDEAAYSEVAKGLVRRVVKTLIIQFADIGILDLSRELSEEGLEIVYATAFGVLVQFEDFRGHSLGALRFPPVVGFMSVPIDGNIKPEEPERVLISPRRTDLHGGVNDAMIRKVFKEIKEAQITSPLKIDPQ